MKIIFILYNIFEVKSGVSNKYIQFIDYLINQKINYLILTCFNENNKNNNQKYNFINLKGIQLFFYNSIKIPIINKDELNKYIENNDIIIFNSEFYWLYNNLYEIKKEKNIKLIPNWHTNYDYYAKLYFMNNSLLAKIKKSLFENLKNNFFSGLITTGEISKNNFLQYSNNVFNANEICLNNFNSFIINKYVSSNQINFIYSGRIALEKNITYIIDILERIEKSKNKFKNYKLHILGTGPYLENLKTYIKKKDVNIQNINNKIIFYGEIHYSEIITIYNQLENRIFIQPSMSETFGKSTMEASYCGIPIFIKKCEIHELLYNENNSFIFETIDEFMYQLTLFFQLNEFQIENIIINGKKNANKYDQKKIFSDLKDFIINTEVKIYDYYNEKIINYFLNGFHYGVQFIKN
jgi:1,2-diacylglycerol 3-alpha-glucosyltransferase